MFSRIYCVKSNEMNYMMLYLNGCWIFFMGCWNKSFQNSLSNCVRTMYRNSFKTYNYHRTPIGKVNWATLNIHCIPNQYQFLQLNCLNVVMIKMCNMLKIDCSMTFYIRDIISRSKANTNLYLVGGSIFFAVTFVMILITIFTNRENGITNV